MENKLFTPQSEQPPQGEEKKLFLFSEQERESLAKAFFGLTDEEFLTLKERIALSHGHVRIFVHPFYISRHPEHYTSKIEGHRYKETDPEVAAEHLEGGFIRTVESVLRNPDSAPLIVFEDEDFLEQTRQDIQARINKEAEEIDFIKSGILLSATGKATDGKSASGSPSQERVRAAYQLVHPEATDTKITYENNFQIYEEALRSLGIQSGTIGGVYFSEWHSAYDDLGQCAGNIRKMFNRIDIPVDLSRYSVTPREQLKEHYKTKQTRDKKRSE